MSKLIRQMKRNEAVHYMIAVYVQDCNRSALAVSIRKDIKDLQYVSSGTDSPISIAYRLDSWNMGLRRQGRKHRLAVLNPDVRPSQRHHQRRGEQALKRGDGEKAQKVSQMVHILVVLVCIFLQPKTSSIPLLRLAKIPILRPPEAGHDLLSASPDADAYIHRAPPTHLPMHMPHNQKQRAKTSWVSRRSECASPDYLGKREARMQPLEFQRYRSSSPSEVSESSSWVVIR